jgi:putative oxidoreductase
MSVPNLVAMWSSLSPYLQGLLRMVAAFMFTLAGSAKLLGFPAGPNASTVPVMSQLGIGAILEILGGALLLLGLFTRPVAFLLAGEMAVAYFQFHFPRGFWPTLNGGVSAALYCFIWLYFSAAGAGAWSLDEARSRRRAPGA